MTYDFGMTSRDWIRLGKTRFDRTRFLLDKTRILLTTQTKDIHSRLHPIALDWTRHDVIRSNKTRIILNQIPMNTIAEVSQQTLRIENILKKSKPGDFVTYKNIESQSGVKMDNKGKGYLRTALNRLKLEYSPVHGEGIELASSSNAIALVSKRVIKIDNSVKKAEKTTKRITNQFYDKLSEAEQKNVNYLSAVFASLRAYSQSAKFFFKKTENKVINS